MLLLAYQVKIRRKSYKIKSFTQQKYLLVNKGTKLSFELC